MDNENWMVKRERELIALGWKKGTGTGTAVTVPAPKKAKEAQLRKKEAVCIYFDESEKEELRSVLKLLGCQIGEYFESPAIIHADKSLTFIRSFAAAMLFHLPEEDFIRARPDIIRIDYEDIKSKALFFCDLLSMGEHIE